MFLERFKEVENFTITKLPLEAKSVKKFQKNRHSQKIKNRSLKKGRFKYFQFFVI